VALSTIILNLNLDIGGIVEHHCLNFLFIITDPDSHIELQNVSRHTTGEDDK
jgi:hypothetical protein